MSLPNATSEFISRSQFSEHEEEDQSTEKDDASNKTGANAQQTQLIADIAARENEMVSRSRNLMMLVLFIGAIGMAMAAYYMSIGTYQDMFVQSVRNFGDVCVGWMVVVCSCRLLFYLAVLWRRKSNHERYRIKVAK